MIRRLAKTTRRGTAGLEFAILAPVLVLLFVGTSEILTLVRTEAKLNELTGAMANLVSLQAPATLSANPAKTGIGTFADWCAGVAAGLQPIAPAGLSIAVESVTNVSPGTGTPSYDYWEVDKPCPGYAQAAPSSAAAAEALAAGIVPNKGDNAIIVRATLADPGITHLILPHAVTLAQTGVGRWREATAASELKIDCTDAAGACTACTAASAC